MDSKQPSSAPPAQEPRPAQRGDSVFAKLLPEISTLTVLFALWLNFMPPWLAVPVEDTVAWLVAVEAATLLLMWTLIDVATRLRRPPPWWLGVAGLAGLLIVYPDVIGLVVAGWQLGLWVFLPLLWSLLERFRELWTLPTASPIEKFRRRALSHGRVGTAVIFGGLFVAALLAHAVLLGDAFDPDQVIDRIGLPALILFYLVAVFDAWRVHRPAFSARPRSLWPFLDMGDTAKMDPL